jgi:hypothetical protein
VNKEIEIVKSHLQELIGIDVSNLVTFGDLSNLEDNLKHYTDAAVDSGDLSDYATKDELPDLSNCVSKSEMYYEGDPTKDVRIKYKTQEVDSEANHKNNICIGGFFSEEGLLDNDYKNVVIGNAAANLSYNNVVIGNSSKCDDHEGVGMGSESCAHGYSISIGYYTQSKGEYGVTIGHKVETKEGGIAIGANCTNSGVYGTGVGYSARTNNYSTTIGASALSGEYGISIGTNCINSQGYVTSIGYNAGGASYSTIIGHNARTSAMEATCIGYNAKVTLGGIAIGTYCENIIGNYIKFWSRFIILSYCGHGLYST